jgi:hypothetical protein
VVVAIAVAFFFLNRSNTVNVNVETTPTPNPVAAAVSPGPPATLVPPTLPPSASLVVSPAAPSPTPTTLPSPRAVPTPSPAPPTQVPTPAAAPATGLPSPPASPVAAAPTAPAAAAPTGTPFSGQVSPAGGLGNTRADLDAAYGAPVGETPEHLVVYRKNNFEYHANFVPDPNGRAALIVQMPQQQGAALDLAQAQTEAHRLLPRDAQPPNPTPEGNAQFVVERFTSQTLAQALPPETFSTGQPGQFLIVYARDAQGNITRWVLGAGNDPNALLNQGR